MLFFLLIAINVIIYIKDQSRIFWLNKFQIGSNGSKINCLGLFHSGYRRDYQPEFGIV